MDDLVLLIAVFVYVDWDTWPTDNYTVTVALTIIVFDLMDTVVIPTATIAMITAPARWN